MSERQWKKIDAILVTGEASVQESADFAREIHITCAKGNALLHEGRFDFSTGTFVFKDEVESVFNERL